MEYPQNENNYSIFFFFEEIKNRERNERSGCIYLKKNKLR